MVENFLSPLSKTETKIIQNNQTFTDDVRFKVAVSVETAIAADYKASDKGYFLAEVMVIKNVLFGNEHQHNYVFYPSPVNNFTLKKSNFIITNQLL